MRVLSHHTVGRPTTAGHCCCGSAGSIVDPIQSRPAAGMWYSMDKRSPPLPLPPSLPLLYALLRWHNINLSPSLSASSRSLSLSVSVRPRIKHVLNSITQFVGFVKCDCGGNSVKSNYVNKARGMPKCENGAGISYDNNNNKHIFNGQYRSMIKE